MIRARMLANQIHHDRRIGSFIVEAGRIVEGGLVGPWIKRGIAERADDAEPLTANRIACTSASSVERDLERERAAGWPFGRPEGVSP